MSSMAHGRRQSTAADPACERGWLRPSGHGAGAEQADALFRTVENEIIPRLMLLHRAVKGLAEPPGGATRDPVVLGERQVQAFTDLIIEGHEPALRYLNALVAQGATLDALCLGLLAPAARRLGDLWNADLCDFTVVTIALGRLQGMLRALSSELRLPRNAACAGRAVLFAPVPGEQHTFGLAMVCDFFRTSGWEVWGEAPMRAEAVVDLVRDRRFDLVGFSIGNDRSIQALAELIRCVRRSSKNRVVRVLAGGPLLVVQPQIAALVGADATAADAGQAMLEAERLIAARDGGR
jgi:MerR family transcriptional regulator, light-induced transcriptional regulator